MTTPSKAFRNICIASVVAVNAADLVTTLIDFKIPGVGEENPLMAGVLHYSGLPGFVAVKAAGTVLMAGLIASAWRRMPVRAVAFTALACYHFGGLAVGNAKLMTDGIGNHLPHKLNLSKSIKLDGVDLNPAIAPCGDGNECIGVWATNVSSASRQVSVTLTAKGGLRFSGAPPNASGVTAGANMPTNTQQNLSIAVAAGRQHGTMVVNVDGRAKNIAF